MKEKVIKLGWRLHLHSATDFAKLDGTHNSPYRLPGAYNAEP